MTSQPDLPGAPAPDPAEAIDPAARWPSWMLPIVWSARLHHGLLATSAADAIALNRHLARPVQWAVPVAAIAIAVLFAAAHALTDVVSSDGEIEWLRLTVGHGLTEAPLYVLLLGVVGALSPAVGALVVVVFGALDLVVSIGKSSELTPLPWALVGRLVGLWVLWLLAVGVPVTGRVLAASIGRRGINRLLLGAVSGATTGTLVWGWTQVAPVLLRPQYLWASLGGVQLAAVQPAQTAGVIFAIVIGAAAGLRAYAAGPSEFIDRRAVIALPPPPALRPAVAIGLRLVGAALLTIGLGGLISSPLDVVLLFVAAAGSGPLAVLLARRTPMGLVVRAMPPLLRAVVAAGLALAAGILLIDRMHIGTGPTEFFGPILVVAIGLFLARLATTARPPDGGAVTTMHPAVTGGLLGLLLVALSLLAPVVVAADNCASFGDCWAAPLLAALAAGVLPTIAAMQDFHQWVDDKFDQWEREQREEDRRQNPWRYKDRLIGLHVAPMAANVPNTGRSAR